MELYASEYERQLKEIQDLGEPCRGRPAVVRAKSSTNSELLMVQEPEVWEAMQGVWDGHLWPLWPRPVDDLLDVWAGFYAYYEMRPVGLEARSVILCTTPDVHSHGIMPVCVMRAKKGEN